MNRALNMHSTKRILYIKVAVLLQITLKKGNLSADINFKAPPKVVPSTLQNGSTRWLRHSLRTTGIANLQTGFTKLEKYLQDRNRTLLK